MKFYTKWHSLLIFATQFEPKPVSTPVPIAPAIKPAAKPVEKAEVVKPKAEPKGPLSSIDVALR